MTITMTADAGTDAIAEMFKLAADDLATMYQETEKMLGEFENHGWCGLLDSLAVCRDRINATLDNLADVAEKVGVGGAVVRAAYEGNFLLGTASKASLGHA
ncbi:hypothetical protein D5S17_23435 [Pseudonocardiaceae bacterium YIM PH 21723]|nr:hypothetical protein D5S17_23435 [Pseudonocardiaceae bacterium YIM PH 21723]